MTIDLATIRLTYGAHNTPSEGLSLLEAVAYMAGEPHSDHPACVSPVLGAFGRRLNDALGDDKRQQLTTLIERLPGTAGDGLDETRGYMALDWMIRVYTQTWLEAAGLTDAGVYLRELPPVVDVQSARVAGEKVRRAREEARAAGDAAGVAAWDAAGDAAGVAAGDAAWDALNPTVNQLQDSAMDLFTRMINPN